MTLPWPFSVGFGFQKARPWRPGVEKGVSTVAEVKYDGWRGLLVNDLGVRKLYSRGVSSVTGSYRDMFQPDHKQPGGPIAQVDALSTDPGDALEMELIWPGHEAAEVATALSDSRLRSELVPVVFGFPYRRGQWIRRWAEQRSYILGRGLPASQVYDISTGQGNRQSFRSFDSAYVAARHLDVEGFIIKEEFAESNRWWKIKERATMDCVVLGTTDAEFGKGGKFFGLIGALIVGVVNDGKCPKQPRHTVNGVCYREIAKISGMDDELRRYMTTIRNAGLVGRVVEVHYQSKGSLERLRSPQFERWREDKPAHECVDDRS